MLCLPGPDLLQRFELLPFQLIIIDEEFLQVIGEPLREVCHFLYLLENVRALRDRQIPVVADHFMTVLIFGLLGLYRADDSASDNDPRKTVEFGNHDHIQRVAVFPFGREQTRNRKERPCPTAVFYSS